MLAAISFDDFVRPAPMPASGEHLPRDALLVQQWFCRTGRPMAGLDPVAHQVAAQAGSGDVGGRVGTALVAREQVLGSAS